MASPEPVNIRADRMSARFNPPVISVNGFDLRDEIPADIPLQVLVEKQFDIFTQFTLITLQVNQIIGFFFSIFLQISRWHPIASMVTIAPSIFSSSSNSGMAVISLDLSSTLRCPGTSFWSQAQAETMWMAAWLELESNDRRRVFPSTATTPSSVSFRLATQLMKQLWNTSISSRENRIPS